MARRDRICEMMELMALWAGNPCPRRNLLNYLVTAGLEARATIWPWGVPTPVGTPQILLSWAAPPSSSAAGN